MTPWKLSNVFWMSDFTSQFPMSFDVDKQLSQCTGRFKVVLSLLAWPAELCCAVLCCAELVGLYWSIECRIAESLTRHQVVYCNHFPKSRARVLTTLSEFLGLWAFFVWLFYLLLFFLWHPKYSKIKQTNKQKTTLNQNKPTNNNKKRFLLTWKVKMCN